MNPKSIAKETALCGMLTALAVVIMCIDSVIPIGLYICPMAASFTLIAAHEEARRSYAWCCFAAEAMLSMLLCTDKECAALFCFLGYYPLVQPAINERINKKPLRVLAKALLFAVSVAAMYSILLFVVGLESVKEEFFKAELLFTAVSAVLFTVLLAMYDKLVDRYYAIYRIRKQRKAARTHG